MKRDKRRAVGSHPLAAPERKLTYFNLQLLTVHSVSIFLPFVFRAVRNRLPRVPQ